MSKATTFTLSTFSRNMASEADKYEPGSPESRVLPKAVQELTGQTAVVEGCWVALAAMVGPAIAATGKAMDAVFPKGAQFMSPKSTPELNLLKESIARGMFSGSDLELFLSPRDAKLSSEERERKTVLQQRNGKKCNIFFGHVAAYFADQTGTGEQAKGGAGKPTGARQPKGGKVNKDTIVEWSFGQLRSIVDKIQTCKGAPPAALELKAALVDLIEDAKQ